MPSTDTQFWLGSPASLRDYVERQMAGMPSTNSSSEPEYFDLVGNIALIQIRGPLTNQPSWWNQSYTDIRNSVIEAAQHPEVAHIVLDIDSGGGSASGVSETQALIRQVNDTVKPVTAYTGGTAASAAYWLASAAGKVYAADTALVGSIGVITTHMEVSKMLENEGIKPTVIRAGSEKALASPYEPLSDKAKAQIESQLGTLYSVFVNSVAANRGVSPEFARQHMADGKEFIGEEAMLTKLIDGVTTLDTLMAGLHKQHAAQGTQSRFSTEIPEMATRRRVLSPEAVAALAEGAPLDAALSDAPEAGATQNPPPAQDPEPAPAQDPAPEETPSAAVPTAADASIVAFLKSELASAQQEVARLTAANTLLQTQVSAMEASHDGMRRVVAERINGMRIALKGSSMDLSGLPAETLLAEHAKVQKEFQAVFPVGGVSALADPASEDAPSDNVTPMAAAIRRVTKL